MALITLCPGCGTTFLVRSAQLQAHGGGVRCGKCNQVFNGFAALITVEESEIEHLLKVVDVLPPVSKSDSISENRLSTPDINSDKGLSLSSFLIWKGEEATQEKEEKEENEITTIPDKADQFAAVRVCKSQRLWGLASAVLLLVLIGQAVYAYRAELFIIAPAARPFLEQYCAVFSCTVPLPQDLTLLSIESSDLRTNPAQQPEITTLDATVRNAALYAQALPALKLILTDIQDKPLASRVFTAEDYLGEKADQIHVLEPNHEVDIRLYFNSNDLNATGYRLVLLYP